MLSQTDIAVIRELAARVAEIAALPVQEEKRALWRKLNGLQPVRPMVTIDQVCWNEMGLDAYMPLRCSAPEPRGHEDRLRRLLFQWEHFPVDMVVEPFVRIPKAVHNSGFGIRVQEETAVTDPTNAVLGHKFTNQFETDADLDKIQIPEIRHDAAETERRMSVAHELFDGLLEIRPTGVDPYVSLWDPISTWMGVENALYALIDKPDYMHELVGRMTQGYLAMLDQLEAQGLLCGPQSLVHCTGAYTDDLPAPGYDPERPRCQDLWVFGLAQMFSTVSPAMFKDFEVDYASRILGRFGLVYYGCCDPLDGKMDEVRLIPKVRKISMSPWANEERGAREIGNRYVYSRKPNPAFVAETGFDAPRVRQDLLTTRRICAAHGCPLEFIFKDISTVCYQPERLCQWAKIAMEVAQG